MKLLNKINIRYILYSLVVMTVSGVLIYALISMFVNRQLDEKLAGIADRVQQKLAENGQVDWLKPFVEVTVVNAPAGTTLISDTLILNRHENEREEYRQLSVVKHINQSNYKIVVRESKLESEDLIQTLAGITLLAILILTTSLILINRNVARSVWAPFYENLRKIEAFKLTEYRPLHLQQTGITEFDALNETVTSLTEQIISDFRNLKQFSEDAAHEMQTPLSVISAKLETLLNDPDASIKQLETIQSTHRAVQRLSKLNKELLLLTKIENNQFVSAETLNLQELIIEKLAEFQEIFELKEITTEVQTKQNVKVKSDPILANLLINNLLSNAINHNIQGGLIRINLNNERLEIQNTGRAEIVNPERVFARFYKENTSGNSVGLGLAVVSKICEVQHWQVSYSYNKPMHCFRVVFKI